MFTYRNYNVFCSRHNLDALDQNLNHAFSKAISLLRKSLRDSLLLPRKTFYASTQKLEINLRAPGYKSAYKIA